MAEGSIAVIGAAGFIGSALVAGAEQAGVPTTRFTRSVPFLLASGEAAPGIAGAGTIYWLASSINPALAETRPEHVQADCRAFQSLLDALARLADPPRLVLLSSGGTVYDPAAPPPYDERSPTQPRGAYGRAKLELERMLAAAALPTGQALTVRVSNAYGPGQPAASGQGVIAYWLRAAARGEQLVLYGEPGSTRDYIYVGDVVAALLRIAQRSGPLPAVLNVGSGRPTSLRELADAVLAVTGLDRPGRPQLGLAEAAAPLVVRPARGFDVPHTWLDVRLATEVLGWAPETTIQDGIRRAWQQLAGPAPRVGSLAGQDQPATSTSEKGCRVADHDAVQERPEQHPEQLQQQPEGPQHNTRDRSAERLRHRQGPARIVGGVPYSNRATTLSLLPGAAVGRWLAAHATLVRGRLLDLGCGNQPFQDWYRPIVEEVVAADAAPLPGVVVIDLGARLPFRDASFDSILCTQVLEHVPDAELAMAEIARVLRPGGHALITVPFLYPIHEAPYDFWRFTHFGLRRLVQRHGLEPVSLSAQGGPALLVLHYLVLALVGGLQRLSRALGPIGWLVDNRLVWALVWMPQEAFRSRVPTRLGRLARRASLGYMVAARRSA